MLETKITKERIKHHFTYSWWKYLIMACVAIFGWNLIYTSTGYRAPRDKRFDVTFVGSGVSDEMQNWLQMEILTMFPEVEDSSVLSILYSEEDSYYGSIQLTTYTAAGEGDVYIMPRERFTVFAQGESFVPLDDAIASGALNLRGIDVTPGTVKNDDGVTAVFGIPLNSLYGLMSYGIDNRDLVAAVMAYSPNVDLAMEWLNWFIETMEAPMPDYLVETESSTGKTNELSEMPSF